MVTKQDILSYIDKIPPIPDSVRGCVNALKSDDLTKAAQIASNDDALGKYLISIVNRASFGFSTRITDFSQIFGILGLDSAKQILTSYLISIFAELDYVTPVHVADNYDRLQNSAVTGLQVLPSAFVREPFQFAQLSLL
jgi:HD-like signal output (HDOD) protein